MGIQWTVQWWVLVHFGQVIKRSVSIDTKYLPSSFLGRGRQANFDWPIAPQKLKLWRLLKIEGSVLMYIVPLFSPTYRWKKNNICQRRWNTSAVLKWRTCWGTYWEPIRNSGGALWELIGKHEKMKRKPFLPPKLKRNRSKAPWAFPLAERKTNLSPIKLAWEVHCPSRH